MDHDATVPHRAWQSTRIWGELAERNNSAAERCKWLLQRYLPNIETLLEVGGTAPIDFTLHDASHAFRVAERMVDIVDPTLIGQLSEYELILALLSAYLHDIGMTPARNKVKDHYQYLISGDSGGMTMAELTAFQNWLDSDGGGVEPPLCQGTPRREELNQAEELVTYYSRHRHNDWSEEWIRESLAPAELTDYPGWVDDLVTICRSHHEGYGELVQERFEPRLVGSPAMVVHLRFLSVMLRVADILEFDPERTPEVILQHRDVVAGSRIYWWKDHHVAMTIEDGRLVVSARPKSAFLYKAVRMMVGDINRELQLAWNLAAEKHYAKCPGLLRDLPHTWTLFPTVVEDLRPYADAFEYIEGSFRPNTRRLLELLSGVELYGNSMMAVRELLQNAFDAVKEQIAWERLRQPIPSDVDLQTTLGRLHHVSLTLDVTDQGARLTCADTGVGMTKAIIEHHFLVSGQARRHDLLELSRRCRVAGFELDRTGQFGIGVLSYFMLARRVTISTKRSALPGDGEPTGWTFSSEGIGSFGELRKSSSVQPGSVVELELRADVCAEPTQWFDQLRSFLADTLVHIPCRFQLRSNLAGQQGVDLAPGWTHPQGRCLSLMLPTGGESHRLPSDLLSSKKRTELDLETRAKLAAATEAGANVQWLTDEGRLPNNWGRYRILLPYFVLPGGASLVFMRVRSADGRFDLVPVGRGVALWPVGTLVTSWKGMKVSIPKEPKRILPSGDHAHVEIDWTSPDGGNITVNRDGFRPSAEAERVMEFLGIRIRQLYSVFQSAHRDSLFATANMKVIGEGVPSADKFFWLSLEHWSPQWAPITFPVITTVSTFDADERKLWWAGRRVQMVPSLGSEWTDDVFDGMSWNTRDASPNKLVMYPSRELRMVGLWSEAPSHDGRDTGLPLIAAEFPPAWNCVCGARLPHFSRVGQDAIVWNRDHPAFRALTLEGWNWAAEVFLNSRDPLPKRAEVLSNRGRIAAWMMSCIAKHEHDLWAGLKERDPQFLRAVWTALYGLAADELYPTLFWDQEEPYQHMSNITPESWHSEYADGVTLKRRYGVTDSGWRLETRRARNK